MSDNKSSILRGTLLLYVRLIVTLVISLYTLRIVLAALGIVDYGTYNTLASLTAILSFVTTALQSACQRNFSFELEKGDLSQLNRVFSVSMHLFLIMALGVLILGESLGLWFVYAFANLPDSRMDAAVLAYQFILWGSVISMIAIPYHSLIVAHEKLNIYAYVSVLEAGLKLGAAHLLFLNFDRLILYSILVFVTITAIVVVFAAYCRRQYPESRLLWRWHGGLFREIFSYSGWNLFGASASVVSVQALNLLLNLFFGPVVNAARAISWQVNTALTGFVLNFTTAMRPPIVKQYAAGRFDAMHRLIFAGSKYAYFLMLGVSLPALLIPDQLLYLWLSTTIPYAKDLVRLTLVASLAEALSATLVIAAQSSTNIRAFQVTLGIVALCVLPISYVALALGAPPESVMAVSALVSLASLFIRLGFLRRMMGFPVRSYLRSVMLPSVLVTLAAAGPATAIVLMDKSNLTGWIVAICSVPWTLSVVLALGLNRDERHAIAMFARRLLRLKPRPAVRAEGERTNLRILFLSSVDLKSSGAVGIKQKISAQIQALRGLGHTVTAMNLSRDSVSVNDRIVRKFRSVAEFILYREWWWWRDIRQRQYDFAYVRHSLFSPGMVFILARLRRAGVQAALEVPTYPYDEEFGHRSLLSLGRALLRLDQTLRPFARFLVQRIITFSQRRVIWGVPTLHIRNCVNFETVRLAAPSSKPGTLTLTVVSTLARWHGVDRAIEGVAEYLRTPDAVPIRLNIVGDGGVRPSLEKLVLEKGLGGSVVFWGTRTGDQLDRIFDGTDVAIGSLGRHRSGIDHIQTLKNREYCARGLPFVYSESDLDFDTVPFVLRVPADESPLDIRRLKRFVDMRRHTHDEVRAFAEKHFNWKNEMEKILIELFGEMK